MRSPTPSSPRSPSGRPSQRVAQSSPLSTRNMTQSLSALTLTSFTTPRAVARFDPLPPNGNHPGAVFLDPHTPFPVDSAADEVVAALAGFRAVGAYPVWEALDARNSSEHDPRYYVREKTRRLHMYLLLTSIIKKMVSLSPKLYHSNSDWTS